MWEKLFCTLLLVGITSGVYGGTEAQLRELLFTKFNNTDYSPRVRPIKDTGNALTLTVDMYLVALNNVDEVEQKITSTAYMKVVWSDVFMTWNSTEYGNITEFTIPQDNIWKPDLALANAYDTITGLGDPFMYLTISSDGSIKWEPYQVFQSTCNLDMIYFPFDTQTCDIQLVTWSSTGEMIQIHAGSDGFNTDAFEENANWNLLSATTFNSTTESTSGLSFSIRIQRKPIFYLINFMIPIVLLSFLNNFVFILPCDSGEKTGYAVILFLSFAIFLLIVTDIMPEGMNTIPVISIYLLFECVLSTVIVFITIAQVRIHNQDEEKPVPSHLQTFTKFTQKVKGKVCLEGQQCVSAVGDSSEDTEVKAPLKVETIEKKKLTDGDGPVVSVDTDDIRRVNRKKATMMNGDVNEHSQASETGDSFGRDSSNQFKKELRDDSNHKQATDDGFGDKDGRRKPSLRDSVKLRLCCGSSNDVVASATPQSPDSAIELKTVSEKTPFRLADILGHNNRVAPDVFFIKPTSMPIYDTSLGVEEMEDIEDLFTSSPPKMANVQMGLRQNSFINGFRSSKTPEPLESEVDSSSIVSSEDEKKDEITWPDVALAMDNFFFALFIFINTVATIIAFSITGSH